MEFSIVTISAFVATLNEITKYIGKNVFGKDIKKFIPIFSILYGVLIGIAGYYTHVSDFGDSIMEAVFLGLSSGAAATGFHQVGKQLSKTDELPDVEIEDVEEVDTELPEVEDVIDDGVVEEESEEDEVDTTGGA